MAISKYVSYDRLAQFWERIRQRYDKKLDSVTGYDNSIEVHSDREIAVRVSSAAGNKIQRDADGLLVEPLHKLTFGPYEYDGTKDVSVTIYDGEYKYE